MKSMTIAMDLGRTLESNLRRPGIFPMAHANPASLAEVMPEPTGIP
jgi:hypothetical protein